MPLPQRYCVTFIYTKFSHGIYQHYSRAILNITDKNDIALSKLAATEVVDVISTTHTGQYFQKILRR